MTTLPVVPARLPRAVRNNNPGNIRMKDPWQGLMPLGDMADEQKDEKEFCVFQSPKWGFRALASTLVTYQDKHGIRTIEGVIARWAPPSENDTRQYINRVVELTQRAAWAILNLHSYDDLRPLCKAIAVVESGSWLFEDADLDTGLTLMGAPPPVQNVASSRTIKTAIGSSVVAVPAIVQAVQQIKPAIDTIAAIKEYLPIAAIVILVVALACIVYYRIDDWHHAKRP